MKKVSEMSSEEFVDFGKRLKVASIKLYNAMNPDKKIKAR